MSLINNASTECMLSELDLFTIPHTQASILKSEYAHFLPATSISGHNPIIFNVSGSSEYYTDLAESYIHLEVEIKNANDELITNDDIVAPTNLLFHTLWKNVVIKLNGINITKNQALYHYKTYLDSILHNNKGGGYDKSAIL